MALFYMLVFEVLLKLIQGDDYSVIQVITYKDKDSLFMYLFISFDLFPPFFKN